jgi:hypothetical protein
MVWPDLKRDMAGIPKISGTQERERERERERCGVPRGNLFTMKRESTVLSGESGSQGREQAETQR